MMYKLLRRALSALSRIGIRGIIVSAALLSAVVLVLRGCVMSGERPPDAIKVESAGALNVDVYYSREGETRKTPLEEYLVGVVAGEMPASFEPQALMAQAVAARTFAVRRMSRFSGSPCGKHGAEICTDSTCCQAYKDEAQLRERWGDGYEYYISRIENAVYETAGLIATYEGEPIEALYHSASGGMTEDAANVFGGDEPYLVSVMSYGEEECSHYESEAVFSREEFVKRANGAFDGANVSATGLEDEVKVVSRYESGRVEKIRIGGARASGREFRRAFELDSANFTLSFSKNKVTVSTVGYGHGVGMSQYGANAMAKNGESFDSIIRHYYSGAVVEPIIP